MKRTQVIITSPFFGTKRLVFESVAKSKRFIKQYEEHQASPKYSIVCNCLMCTCIQECETIQPGIM